MDAVMKLAVLDRTGHDDIVFPGFLTNIEPEFCFSTFLVRAVTGIALGRQQRSTSLLKSRACKDAGNVRMTKAVKTKVRILGMIGNYIVLFHCRMFFQLQKADKTLGLLVPSVFQCLGFVWHLLG